MLPQNEDDPASPVNGLPVSRISFARAIDTKSPQDKLLVMGYEKFGLQKGGGEWTKGIVARDGAPMPETIQVARAVPSAND